MYAKRYKNLDYEVLKAKIRDLDYDIALAMINNNLKRVYFFINLVFSIASYGLSKYSWYFCAGITMVLVRLQSEKSKFASWSIRVLWWGINVKWGSYNLNPDF